MSGFSAAYQDRPAMIGSGYSTSHWALCSEAALKQRQGKGRPI